MKAGRYDIALAASGVKNTKVQKVHLPQPIPNLGETIPVPVQECLYTYKKAETLRCLALRTKCDCTSHT